MKDICPECGSANWPEGSLLEHVNSHIPWHERLVINAQIGVEETWEAFKRWLAQQEER